MNPSIINRKKIITKYNLYNESKDKEINDSLKNDITKNNIEINDTPKNDTNIYDSIKNNREIYNRKIINRNILSRLPSSLNKFNRNSGKYNFYIKEALDTREPNFKTDKTIQLCIYKIIDKNMIQPFILYLLYKNTENTFYFPNYKTNNIIDIKSKLTIIYQNYSNIPEYVGYKETKNNIYIFFNDTNEYNLEQINYLDNWWWVTIFEIMNNQKVMNFHVNRSVYSIFYKEPLLYTIFDNNDNKLNSGISLYYGSNDSYISFIIALGMPKTSPFSNLGPYYYFYSYYGAGRGAIWNLSRKSEKKNGEEITRNEYGVYKRGGLVRYIIFGYAQKYFLNKPEDEDDTSEITKEKSKDSEFIRETTKIRDVDGKWAINFDLAYIGSTIVNLNNENIKTRRLQEQYACRDYYQYYPLSYHYVNTDKFAYIEDPEIAKNAPFEYKEYDIE